VDNRSSRAQSWREQLLHTLTHWGALFGAVIAVGVTIRAFGSNFIDVRHPAFAAMFAGYGAIVVLRLVPAIPYRAKAIALLLATIVAAGSAITLRGLAAAPVLLLGFGVVIGGLFLGRAGMLGSLLLAGATVAFVGRPEQAAAFSAWSSAIDVVCVAGVMTVLVQFVVSLLEGSLEHSSRALERLRAEQALRERAQGELTHAQAALQQTQKLDAVGRLAGGVAHDFNNTLQVVLGWTELLQNETNPQKMRDGVEHIATAAERSRGLTRQLLSFSRPEMATPTRVDLHHFLPMLVKSYRRLLPDDVSIVAHTTPGLAILMDEGHLSQVILNIVLNARDAMPTGGTIAVLTRLTQPDELPPGITGFDGGVVEIDVTDTGTGMDEETRSRVFEPFFTTKGKRGTGLGLSTAYGVVQQAQGAIEIESEPGRGTSVRLFFSPAASATTISATEARRSLPSPRQTVLLAEDDRDVRTTLAAALRQAGHLVVEVGDVEAGRVVVRERGAQFEVLVTDGIMPGGSTRQLIDDYLAARPDGRVVVCSGYIDDELAKRDLATRNFEFVPKPFSPSELVARLDSTDRPVREVPVPKSR
jgi:signal transduction histidine kinase/ActR/RegA family two-component response regulator